MVTKEYCKCGGNAGYLLEDGDLVCQSCGGVSPRVRVTARGEIYKLGDKTVRCPKCGTIIQEARPELKIGVEPENKMAEVPNTKRIVPRGIKRLIKRR